MEKLILFFTALFQMTLSTWFLMMLEPRYKQNISRIIIFVIMSAGIITLLLPSLTIMGYFNRYLVYLLIILMGKFLLDINLRSIVLDLLFIFVIFYLVQTLRTIHLKILYPYFEGFHGNANSISSFFILNMYLLFFVVICKLNKALKDSLIKLKKYMKKSPIIVLHFAVTILIAQLKWEILCRTIWENLYIYIIFIWVLFLINIVGLKYSVDLIEKSKELDSYKRYYSTVDEMFKEISSKQHEFKNHLTVINGMLEMNNESNFKIINDYTKLVNSELKDTGLFVNLKNKIIAALIYMKTVEANEQGINLEYYIDEIQVFPIYDYELAEVIGNLLDNAFEAFKGEEKAQKHVLFIANYVNKKHVLEVRNNGKPLQPKDVSNIFSYGFSTKGKNRGYGLYNVKNIVSRNSGKIEVLLEMDYTVFKIVF